jgi:transcriptional regulator with XRE-family HTH domain
MVDEQRIAKEFGAVLRDIRTSRNLSQERLAQLSGLDRTYISLLERGLRQPSLATMVRVAQALGTDLSHLAKLIQARCK